MKHYNEAEASAIVSACGKNYSIDEAADFLVRHWKTIGEDVTVFDVWVAMNIFLRSIS